MVVAQIGVGEDIVADRLARPKPAAMADHQPRLGPHHREMVAHRLRIGRAYADIDQGDAAAIGGNEVVGGHLVPPPAALGDLGDRIGGVGGDEHPARRREGFIRAALALQLLDRPAHELVDVTDIVGEQQVALGVLGRRAGIMPQPRQAEIDPRAVEQRQGPARPERMVPGAVGDLVADMGELGGREPAAEIGGERPVEAQVVGAVEDVGVGDLARGTADRNLDVVIRSEKLELLGQIFAEQPRLGDARRVAAGPVQPPVGPRREFRRGQVAIIDAKLRIGEQALGPGLRIGALAVGEVARQGGAQGRGRFVGDGRQRIDEGGDVVTPLGEGRAHRAASMAAAPARCRLCVSVIFIPAP